MLSMPFSLGESTLLNVKLLVGLESVLTYISEARNEDRVRNEILSARKVLPALFFTAVNIIPPVAEISISRTADVSQLN